MEDMLLLAREDLNIAKLLFKQKKCSNSLYHYHQSVEKAVKYVGLASRTLSDENLYNEIKHDPIKVYKFLFNNSSNHSDDFGPDLDKHFFTNAKQIVELLSEENILSELKSKIVEFSREKKAIIVPLFSSYNDKICNFLEKKDPNFKSMRNIEGFKQIIADYINKHAKHLIFYQNYGPQTVKILLLHSLICFKYNPDTFRYSSTKLGNPIDYFNESNPFIRDLPFLLKSLDYSVKIASKIGWNLDYKNSEV